MADLPTGTVTFLFTDIEGSTQLARAHPAQWESARRRHNAILRAAAEAQQGHVFQIIGDGFAIAFHTATEALAAAVSAQRELLLTFNPSESIVICVRMGLHSGTAELRDGEYIGYLTLAQVQRVMSTAYGGQTLVSNATALLAGNLSDGVALRDMGEHRLKGLPDLERLWQVVAPGLPQDFPPLHTLNATPNNLPSQVTSFVGRERELSEVKRLLATTRLLTLTGSGGTGKTRLSLQLAADNVNLFTDGVWFVEFAPVADPLLLTQVLASVLHVREQPGSALTDALIDYLRAKKLLLIFDNCEHLVEACARLTDSLLHACPNLQILASSREALGINGETIYRVPSLETPNPKLPISTEVLRTYESVRLFVERAKAVKPAFEMTEANATAVLQICTRLDGIPLAIELAAARVKLFSPEQIAVRLDDRFRLLTGGSRAALPRQQTLRALIDWSYDLLSEPERTLLCRLSVFAGGWTLEAAEAVGSRQSPVSSLQYPVTGSQTTDNQQADDLATDDRRLEIGDVLDLLSRLADKSLVVVDELEGGDGRYRLLETMRQYAHERLLAAGDSAATRERQCAFYLALAEHAELKLYGSEQLLWQDRLELEYDNIRAALEWALSGQADSALRLASAMHQYWALGGHATEGRLWLQKALGASERLVSGETPPARLAAHSKVLLGLGQLALEQGDVPAARLALEESILLARASDDQQQLAFALNLVVAPYAMLGNLEAARAVAEENLILTRAIGDKYNLALTFSALGTISVRTGDYAQAQAYMEQNIRLVREIGNPWLTAYSSMMLGHTSLAQERYADARMFFGESELQFRQMKNSLMANGTASELANIARLEGEYAQATRLFQQATSAWYEMGHRGGIARCLECLGFCAGALGNPQRAARLLGAAESLRETLGAAMTPQEQAEYAEQLPALRGQLSESPFNAHWAEGRALTLEQAVALALEKSK